MLGKLPKLGSQLDQYVRSDARWLKSTASVVWRHPLRLIGFIILLAAIAAFINWIITTSGAGFEEQIVGTGGTRQRTLWDWLDLLLIPVVLGVSALLFNIALQRRQTQLAREERDKDRELAQEENRVGREIATDRSQEETLRHYLDTMQRLMLDRDDGGLRHGADSGLRNVARARTLAVIRALSGSTARINQVISFLRESDLLDVVDGEGKPVVDEPAVTLAAGDFALVELGAVRLELVNLRRCNLREAHLEGADLGHAQLQGANLTRAHLESAYLGEAHLARANLSEAYLERANLGVAHLEASSLSRAHLERAILTGALLSDAYLDGAHLAGAYLLWAHLAGAYLNGALLEGADLERTDLEGAVLHRARMRTTRNVTRSQLDSAIIDETTELPEEIDEEN